MLYPKLLFRKISNLPWYINMQKEWIDNLKKKNGKILEIGCANGYLCD